MISANRLNAGILELAVFKNVPEPLFTFGINERSLFPKMFEKHNVERLYTCNPYTMDVQEYLNTGHGEYTGGDMRFFAEPEDAVKDAHNISMARAASEAVKAANKTRETLKTVRGK